MLVVRYALGKQGLDLKHIPAQEEQTTKRRQSSSTTNATVRSAHGELTSSEILRLRPTTPNEAIDVQVFQVTCTEGITPSSSGGEFIGRRRPRRL